MSDRIPNLVVRSDFYVYVLLDPRHSGSFNYGELSFTFEPFYVGKGCGLRARSHHSDKKPSHKKHRLVAIKSAGLRALPIKLFVGLTEDRALLYEMQTVLLIGRRKDGTGPLTNGTLGGGGIAGWKHSEEARQKMQKPKSQEAVANMKAAQALRPKERSTEQREKISKALKGRKLPDEVKLKMIGRKAHNKGVPLSNEQKAHLWETLKGRRAWNKGVPMCADKYAKCSPTMFKRGQAAHNKGKTNPEMIGNTNALGYRHTPEARAKIGAASRGVQRSDDVKAKISFTKAMRHVEQLIGYQT